MNNGLDNVDGSGVVYFVHGIFTIFPIYEVPVRPEDFLTPPPGILTDLLGIDYSVPTIYSGLATIYFNSIFLNKFETAFFRHRVRSNSLDFLGLVHT